MKLVLMNAYLALENAKNVQELLHSVVNVIQQGILLLRVPHVTVKMVTLKLLEQQKLHVRHVIHLVLLV